MRIFEIKKKIQEAVAGGAPVEEIESLQLLLEEEEAELEARYDAVDTRRIVRQHFAEKTETAYERSRRLNHRNKKKNNKWVA